MTKQKMARKKQNNLLNVLMWVVGVIASLGFAGLFLNGTMMETFLGFLPLFIHQVVGWVLIATTIWAGIQEFM